MSITIEVCKRSGTDTISCGLSACEYGCDIDYIECVPASQLDKYAEALRRIHYLACVNFEDPGEMGDAIDRIAEIAEGLLLPKAPASTRGHGEQ